MVHGLSKPAIGWNNYVKTYNEFQTWAADWALKLKPVTDKQTGNAKEERRKKDCRHIS